MPKDPPPFTPPNESTEAPGPGIPRSRPRRAKHCLRGTLGGIEQTFPLKEGDNRVGSLESNDVFLPRRGVSRHHAILRLEGDEVQVEDLGSKNGTFVNSQRIGTARLRLGHKIRFGPVAVYFQEYHQDDAELAISFERPAEELTGVVPIRDFSGSGLETKLSRHWWTLAEAFHLRLLSRPGGDLGAALRLLTEELYLKSACLIEIDAGGDPIVLSASGQLDQTATSTLKGLYFRALEGHPLQEFLFHSTESGSSPETTFIALDPGGSAPLILALWGSFPGRISSQPMLRLLLRMMEPYRPRFEPQSKTRGPAHYPNLVVPPDYVYGQSEKMNKVYRLIESLAPGDLPILIIGETGVGKEYLAQILHLSSPRRSGPFVAINCAAIPAELLESELFGIGEGVATGVSANRGRIQQAHGGTLVLDEIGDMSPDLQAKLLRALQEKEIHPVGRDPVSIDVRVLASTNQDLTRRIEGGLFRSDLYYRLAGYVLELPPLRDRPEDIPALVEHFLRACARELDRPIRGVTVRALRLLSQYPWPGNIRELANEVRRAVYLCSPNGTVESSILSETLLAHAEAVGSVPTDESVSGVGTFHNAEGQAGGSGPPPLGALHPSPGVSGGGGPGGLGSDPSQVDTSPNGLSSPGAAAEDSSVMPPLPGPMAVGLDSLHLASLEKAAVVEALRRCRGNQVQAAKLLGITRQSLRRRMERWEISR